MSATNYRDLAAAYGALVNPDGIVVPVPAEAVVALEALAVGIGKAGHRVLNLASSRYGELFADWLTAAGATVHTVRIPDGEAIDPVEVARLLDANPDITVVALTQAEVLTAVSHPVDAIVDIAHARGVAVSVDSVAAIGGLPAPQHADAVVIGPQKAIGGPFGISFAIFTELGWGLLANDVESASVLSLPVQRVAADRIAEGAQLPIVSEDELAAARRAVDELAEEGLDTRIARHARVRRAIRAGLIAAGLEPLAATESAGSALATAVLLPAGLDGAAIAASSNTQGGAWVAGGRRAERDFLRLSHFGARASLEHALTQVSLLVHAIAPERVGDAASAVVTAWLRA